MPTREYSEEERQEAREAGERLKEECEHSKSSGECLLYHAMCYFEDQKECPEYGPRFSKNDSKKIKKEVK